MIGLVWRLAAALVVLALVWHFANGRAALERLAQADWRWLAAAVLAVNLQTVLSALRWRLTASALGQPITPGYAIGEYYLAQLINQTLPGGVLGDASRAVRARHSADLLRSGQAVVIERLAGQIALGAVLLPALVVTGKGLWALGAVAVVSVGVSVAGALPKLRALMKPLQLALLGRAVRNHQIALAVSIVACNLASFAFCAYAIGAALPLSAIVTLVPLILSAMLVPLSIAGWGWREGAAAALFPLAGATPGAGLAASAAFGAILLLSALPGLAWLARRQDITGTP